MFPGSQIDQQGLRFDAVRVHQPFGVPAIVLPLDGGKLVSPGIHPHIAFVFPPAVQADFPHLFIGVFPIQEDAQLDVAVSTLQGKIPNPDPIQPVGRHLQRPVDLALAAGPFQIRVPGLFLRCQHRPAVFHV